VGSRENAEARIKNAEVWPGAGLGLPFQAILHSSFFIHSEVALPRWEVLIFR
jgi:hypothetical protein